MKNSLLQFWSKNIITNLIIFLIFLTGLWLLQDWALRDNLNYGFRDGDWWILLHFKTFGNSPIEHLINTWKEHTVYSYQVYYSGILVHFLGLNFPSLYQASHVFKYLAVLSIFPAVYLLSKSKLTAVLSTIFFAVSYSSVGALYMFITGAYYVAIIFLSIFLTLYYLAVRNNKSSHWLFGTSIFLVLTLFLNTERMYPLIPAIILIELYLVWKKNWTKGAIYTSLHRLFIIFLPLLIISMLYMIYAFFIRKPVDSVAFIPGFINEASQRVLSIQQGNWQLLIYPFASLGSLFLHNDFWRVFGVLNLTSFTPFIVYLISKPLFILSIPTFILMYFISNKPIRWTAIILGSELSFYILGYWIYKNWFVIDKSVRIHFDPNLILTPAAFGFYILVLNICIFLIWLNKKYEDSLLPTIFIGPLLAFLFIFFTWMFSDVQLLFMGPQRYLTVPAIGSSVFMAAIITLTFNKLRTYSLTKNIAPLVLLTALPVVFVNIRISQNFFDYELNYAGMDGVEQTRMKNEFWAIAPTMSNTERSLFYFDETANRDNGYFNESTILAGFEDWTAFYHGKMLIIRRPEPGNLRTNVQCPEHTHQSCIQLMKNGLRKVDGEEGILYADSIRYPDKPRFYKLKNFYALRFVNKHLVDIREEVLKELVE